MKILFVAPGNISHTGKWISQLAECGWDIHLFSVDETELHPQLTGITAYMPWKTEYPIPKGSKIVYYWPFARGKVRFKKKWPAIGKLLVPEPSVRLARLVRQLKPDVIHSLRMQTESYQVLAVQNRLGGRLPAPWIYSSWGSDIHLWQNNAAELARIKQVLAGCDYLIPDCNRDALLVRRLGYKGEIPGVFPTAGAFDVEQMVKFRRPGVVSQRRIIAVKGYQHAVMGKALTSLEAIKLAAHKLQGYLIVVHSAIGTYASRYLSEVQASARELTENYGLTVEFLPLSPAEKIWELFGKARLSIGISASDGMPNTVIESMIMGAFPIQSDTGAANEYINHGINGALVPYDDPQMIAENICLAIDNDALVDEAAEKNLQIARQHFDVSVLRPQIVAMYERVAHSSERIRK